MNAKAKNKLEEGMLVRSTIEGVFTEINDRHFLSLEDCLLQIVDNSKRGIKASDDIEVRVVRDFRSLETELCALEELYAQTQFSHVQESSLNAFSDLFFRFAKGLEIYAPKFTVLLPEEERAKYNELFTRVFRIVLDERFSGYLERKISGHEASTRAHIDEGNVFISRYGELGSEMLDLLSKIAKAEELINYADSDGVNEFRSRRKEFSRNVSRLRNLVKGSILKIRPATEKGLRQLLDTFDYFERTHTDYKPNLKGSEKTTRVELRLPQLDKHYTITLDGSLVGGFYIESPDAEERVYIGGRKFRGKDKNIVIHSFGCSKTVDGALSSFIKEVHEYLIREQECWRVYGAYLSKNVENLKATNQKDWPETNRKIHLAMLEAGFAQNKIVKYTPEFMRKHELVEIDGEIIYRTAGTRQDHPGRTAE